MYVNLPSHNGKIQPAFMCVCMPCMPSCVSIFMCVYIHVCLYALYAFMCVYIHVCLYACMPSCVSIFMCVYMPVCLHVCLYSCVSICLYAFMCVYITCIVCIGAASLQMYVCINDEVTCSGMWSIVCWPLPPQITKLTSDVCLQ